jgi:hypothetical protein
MPFNLRPIRSHTSAGHVDSRLRAAQIRSGLLILGLVELGFLTLIFRLPFCYPFAFVPLEESCRKRSTHELCKELFAGAGDIVLDFECLAFRVGHADLLHRASILSIEQLIEFVGVAFAHHQHMQGEILIAFNFLNVGVLEPIADAHTREHSLGVAYSEPFF